MATSTYQPEEIVLQKEEFSYGFIIEVLTRGLYPNKHHVLREYIQNSFDAVLAWRKRINDPDYGKIIIKVANPSVYIYDDGIGMDSAKINQYRYVGYSEKKTGESVGFRGIGKLSGISVADKLIVTTSPFGIKERYQLIFNAGDMLSHIMNLKLEGQNISLNELMEAHTSLTKEDEEAEKHYTMVELYNIKSDSKSLMDDAQISEYLGMNVPVDFDPIFPYGKTIDGWLRQYVPDYDTVPLSLNGTRIYKPFLPGMNSPQKGFVFNNDDSDSIVNKQDPLAFYWYCEHNEKGQFNDKVKRGMFYKVKNFTVGTNQLPRITLWKASPERAYYFCGEIHVCDPEVVPSSDRENFEQNDARENLYHSGTQISRTLNALAGESSSQRRAIEFIESAENLIQTVHTEVLEGGIPKEVKFTKMFSIQDAVIKVRNRLKDAPDDFKKRGEEIINSGNLLIKNLEKESSPLDETKPVYDIVETLNLSKEATTLYEIIIKSIEEELQTQPELYERIIRKIHSSLANYSQISKHT